MLVGPKIRCCAKPCKRDFFGLPCWFGFTILWTLVYSKWTSYHNPYTLQPISERRQFEWTQPFLFEVLGRELLVLQKEWKRCASCNWIGEARCFCNKKHTTNYQCSRKSPHFHATVSYHHCFSYATWYAAFVFCTSASNETRGPWFPWALQGWKRWEIKSPVMMPETEFWRQQCFEWNMLKWRKSCWSNCWFPES